MVLVVLVIIDLMVKVVTRMICLIGCSLGIMAAALSPFASTKETTNYARLCRLLVDVGSQVLRSSFDKIHPPATLYTV